jgi:hypothetical protein
VVSNQTTAQILRSAIREALPEIDHSGPSTATAPGAIYVPPSHAKALHPDNSLVEGIRGSGKSFWWATLSSEPHRRILTAAFPETQIEPKVTIERGFGAQPSSIDAPSQDVLADLVRDFPPRAIWRAVLACKAKFATPFPAMEQVGAGVWRQRVAWVASNPEAYDALLQKADQAFDANGKTLLVLFDALDRLADDWQHIRPLAKALLQLALDVRGTRRIRLKLFCRPDMLEDKGITGFPDASKLLARKTQLVWRRTDLYALLYQCLGNAAGGGETFRNSCTSVARLDWEYGESAWFLPKVLRTDEAVQEQIFVALAGQAMASGPSGIKRGKPYSWLVNHLQDGRDQVSPRSFIEAVRKAAENTPDEHSLALHFKGIQQGVQAASRIRVNEITGEDYHWVAELMHPLRGRVTVPCESEDIASIWRQERSLDRLHNSLLESGDGVKLPPQSLDQGAEGVLNDLEALGLIQRLSNRRIQMPDVYRIAFGLGRRGGVKPLR